MKPLCPCLPSCLSSCPSAYVLYDATRTVLACVLAWTALTLVCTGIAADANLAR